MVSIPIEWHLGIKGSDEVKSELDQLSAAFNKAKISGGNYGKEQRALSTAVNRRINEDRMENRLLLAQHPNLLRVSRAMSTLSSITRSLLTLQNALNLSKIASSQVDVEGMNIQKDLNEAYRERSELLKLGKKGTDEWIRNEEEINILLAEQKEHIQNLKDTNFNEWITSVTGIIFAGSTAFMAFSKHLSSIIGFFGKLGTLSAGLLNPFTAIGVAMALIGGSIADWLVGLLGIGKWRENNGRLLEEFFTVSIPLALGQAGLALTQFFLNDLPIWATSGLKMLSDAFINTWNSIIMTTNAGVNAVISGVNVVINGAISAINSFISAINNILRKAKLGTISLIPKFSGIPPINIPTIAAAKGFNGMVNSPTMFLAGEAGQEHVSITPNGRSSGGNTIIINIAGSVVTEKKLAYMVDQVQKQNLKSRGFTGFG